METAISLSKHIYSILKGDKELKALVGNNIFPLIAEDSVQFPFVIIKKSGIQTEYSKDGRVYDIAEFQILIVSNKYENSITIAERVREIIELNKDPHFKETKMTGVGEDYIDDSYIQELSFTTIVE